MIFATGGWASANLKNAHCSSITNLCDGPGSTGNGASRNSGWYAGGGFDYLVHRGALVDMVLGVEYQHFDVSGSPRSASTQAVPWRPCVISTSAPAAISCAPA